MIFLKFFTCRQVKGNARDDRSRQQSFRVCEVNLATPKGRNKYPIIFGAFLLMFVIESWMQCRVDDRRRCAGAGPLPHAC